MSENEDKFEDHKVFSENFLRDPFKEEQFVYKTTGESAYFRIHVTDAADAGAKRRHPNAGEERTKIQSQHKGGNPNHHRNLKTILNDAARQIIASAIILVIGFFLLNFSAYKQIIQSKWERFTGTQTESPLTEITEINRTVYTQEVLAASGDPDVQKKQIPALNLEIAPSDNRIIIPRIDQNIPIARVSSESLIKRDWDALEKEMQDALQNGVVHYPGTSLPGQTGNIVITGHSSYFPWDPGRFKDVFALLHDVVVGDRIVVYYEQDKYLYEVIETKIVLPKDIEVLKQTPQDRLTLITCTPVGTNLKRLIVSAKPIAVNDVELEGADKIVR